MNDARPDRPRATGRALLVVAGVCMLAAVGFVVAAFWPSDIGDTSVLDATPATAAASPTTIALLTTPSTAATRPTADGGEPGASSATSAPTSTEPTIALSPLAELLGVPGSAIPPTIEPRVRPSSVTIDDIDLWGPVRAVGLEEDGQLEVPDETEIGWYRYGSSPGRAGATVLAAHVTWNGSIGPFFMLRDLDPGARVDVRLEDGTRRTYEVVERTIYDKDELPRNRIWRTTGDESLVLITCGGSFNPDINRYRENIVVYAVPVEADTIDAG